MPKNIHNQKAFTHVMRSLLKKQQQQQQQDNDDEVSSKTNSIKKFDAANEHMKRIQQLASSTSATNPVNEEEEGKRNGNDDDDDDNESEHKKKFSNVMDEEPTVEEDQQQQQQPTNSTAPPPTTTTIQQNPLFACAKAEVSNCFVAVVHFFSFQSSLIDYQENSSFSHHHIRNTNSTNHLHHHFLRAAAPSDKFLMEYSSTTSKHLKSIATSIGATICDFNGDHFFLAAQIRTSLTKARLPTRFGLRLTEASQNLKEVICKEYGPKTDKIRKKVQDFKARKNNKKNTEEEDTNFVPAAPSQSGFSNKNAKKEESNDTVDMVGGDENLKPSEIKKNSNLPSSSSSSATNKNNSNNTSSSSAAVDPDNFFFIPLSAGFSVGQVRVSRYNRLGAGTSSSETSFINNNNSKTTGLERLRFDTSNLVVLMAATTRGKNRKPDVQVSSDPNNTNSSTKNERSRTTTGFSSSSDDEHAFSGGTTTSSGDESNNNNNNANSFDDLGEQDMDLNPRGSTPTLDFTPASVVSRDVMKQHRRRQNKNTTSKRQKRREGEDVILTRPITLFGPPISEAFQVERFMRRRAEVQNKREFFGFSQDNNPPFGALVMDDDDEEDDEEDNENENGSVNSNKKGKNKQENNEKGKATSPPPQLPVEILRLPHAIGFNAARHHMFEIVHQYPLDFFASSTTASKKIKIAYPAEIEMVLNAAKEAFAKNNNNTGDVGAAAASTPQSSSMSKLRQSLVEAENILYQNPLIMRLIECRRVPKKKSQLQIAPTSESALVGAIPV